MEAERASAELDAGGARESGRAGRQGAQCAHSIVELHCWRWSRGRLARLRPLCAGGGGSVHRRSGAGAVEHAPEAGGRRCAGNWRAGNWRAGADQRRLPGRHALARLCPSAPRCSRCIGRARRGEGGRRKCGGGTGGKRSSRELAAGGRRRVRMRAPIEARERECRERVAAEKMQAACGEAIGAEASFVSGPEARPGGRSAPRRRTLVERKRPAEASPSRGLHLWRRRRGRSGGARRVHLPWSETRTGRIPARCRAPRLGGWCGRSEVRSPVRPAGSTEQGAQRRAPGARNRSDHPATIKMLYVSAELHP